MIIIGHPWVESLCFAQITSEEEIQKTQANQMVLLEPLAFSHTLALYCKAEHVPFSLKVESIHDALFANALGARYIVCTEADAKMIQPIAQEYLFDTRILAQIEDEKKISTLAKIGIDGVIFRKGIC